MLSGADEAKLRGQVRHEVQLRGEEVVVNISTLRIGGILACCNP